MGLLIATTGMGCLLEQNSFHSSLLSPLSHPTVLGWSALTIGTPGASGLQPLQWGRGWTWHLYELLFVSSFPCSLGCACSSLYIQTHIGERSGVGSISFSYRKKMGYGKGRVEEVEFRGKAVSRESCGTHTEWPIYEGHGRQPCAPKFSANQTMCVNTRRLTHSHVFPFLLQFSKHSLKVAEIQANSECSQCLPVSFPPLFLSFLCLSLILSSLFFPFPHTQTLVKRKGMVLRSRAGESGNNKSEMGEFKNSKNCCSWVFTHLPHGEDSDGGGRRV